MKMGRASIAGISLWVLAIQLGIVSTVAAKYLYQRWTCPRVWARSEVYDPEMLMRGRYLSLQVSVNGCQDGQSSEKIGTLQDKNSDQAGRRYYFRGAEGVGFQARLKVSGSKLMAVRIPDADEQSGGQVVVGVPGANCADMRLDTPVDFYIAEQAADPSWLKAGQELWVEVTVPPKGPPRPLQLALKDNGVWKPLNFR